jgi:hypothetical protein
METAVIQDGEDKYCNPSIVILADYGNALKIKIGKFLLDNIDDSGISTTLQALNAEHEPDPDSFPDTEAGEQAYDAAHEAWEDYEPSDDACSSVTVLA